MIDTLLQANWVYFFHIVGIIIALGSVTVIDSLGFLGRTSKHWTYITIHAHYVTKTLIWIGTSIVSVTFVLIVLQEGMSQINILKSVLLIVLICNGLFLSTYVSHRLTAQKNSKSLLPKPLQQKIMISFIISLVCWWSFVFVTVAL